MTYLDAYNKLANVGFVNIKYDVKLGIFAKKGKIEKITIGKKKKFSCDELVKPNENIVISYHDLTKNKSK